MDIERPHRLPGGRAVLGGILMAGAAVGVFTAYQQAGQTPRDAAVVAAGPIRVGQVLSADDLRVIEIDLGSDPPPAFDRIDAVTGRVALGPIGEGELLQPGSLTTGTGAPGLHEVALTLPRAQLAVGRLKPGERVDLYVTREEQTRTVARGAEVVELSADDGGSLTSSREITLVVAVSGDEEVAAIVHALRTGDVTVVRSTFDADDGPPLVYDDPARDPAAGPG